MQKVIRTLDELKDEASAFIHSLVPQNESATLVTLSGELGAGKTAFTKGVAAALGVEDTVTSPTFVLEKIYALPIRGGETATFKNLVHIDAYRLKSGAELSAIGFAELMRDSGNLILLEWPEKVSEALPQPAARISLVTHEDGSRTMAYG